MKTPKLQTILYLLLIPVLAAVFQFAAASTSVSTRYWIALTRCEGNNQPCQICLMQIDAQGNITIPVRPVVPVDQIGRNYGAIGLAKDSTNRIVLWIGKGPKTYGSGLLRRAVIDSRSLQLLTIRKTGIRTANQDWLSVSQKHSSANFVAVPFRLNSDEFVLSAFGLSGQMLTGRNWLLSERRICEGINCNIAGNFGGAVSSDGRLAILVSGRELLSQRLDSRGEPFGNPKLVYAAPELGHNLILYCGADATAPLPSARRLIAYAYELVGNDQRPAKVYLQELTLEGDRVGDRILLMDGPFLDSLAGPNLAIDPSGHFVVAAGGLSRLGNSPLVFQSLDATGHPSGKAKILAQGVGYIDLLKD